MIIIHNQLSFLDIESVVYFDGCFVALSEIIVTGANGKLSLYPSMQRQF